MKNVRRAEEASAVAIHIIVLLAGATLPQNIFADKKDKVSWSSVLSMSVSINCQYTFSGNFFFCFGLLFTPHLLPNHEVGKTCLLYTSPSPRD